MLDDRVDPGQPVPEWLIERLVADDLPGDQAAEVRARLAAHGQLDRIHELTRANRETLALYPARSVAAEIERRVAASEISPPAATVGRTPFWQRVKRRFVESRPGIARTGLAFVGGTILGWYLKTDLLRLLVLPFAEVWPDESIRRPTLHFSSPASLFHTYLWLAITFGLIAALPVLLRELWVFVASGSHSHAKKLTARFVASSFAVFVASAWYCLRLLPQSFRYLTQFALPAGSELVIEPTLLVSDYIEFATRAVLVFGVAAEIPVFVLFLRFAGIVTHRDLVRFFRYFAAMALVFAALVMPRDPFGLILVALPLSALYGLSVGLAFVIFRRRAG
jgi:sec-independent protein translocase protein TatC